MGDKPLYNCAWCPQKFINRWDRDSHEGSCLEKGGEFPTIASDPLFSPPSRLTVPDSSAFVPMLDEMEKFYSPSSASAPWMPPKPAPSPDEILRMKFDKAVDHLLTLMTTATNPDNIEKIANALEVVTNSQDIFTEEEE